MADWHGTELEWRIRQTESLLGELNRIQSCHDIDTRISLMEELIKKTEQWLEYLHWQQDTNFEGSKAPKQ